MILAKTVSFFEMLMSWGEETLRKETCKNIREFSSISRARSKHIWSKGVRQNSYEHGECENILKGEQLIGEISLSCNSLVKCVYYIKNEFCSLNLSIIHLKVLWYLIISKY